MQANRYQYDVVDIDIKVRQRQDKTTFMRNNVLLWCVITVNLYRYDINTKSRLQSTDVCDASTDTVVGIGNRYRYDIVDTDTEYKHLKVTCKCPKRYNC